MAERPLASYSGDKPYVFVSYGHKDDELVYPEIRWLQGAGFNLWYDEGIHVGSIWRKAIADALTAASGMLFIATASSVESDNCLKELNFVLDDGKPVFVIRLDDTRLPSLLRLSLGDRQMLNRADLPEAEYRARLMQALSSVAPPTPRVADEPTKRRQIVTTVPSIGVQILSAADDATAFWAEGLIDDLAIRLGHRLFVISTTHDATKDLATLGRVLDVDYVVSGNVRRVGERYRVNLKLTAGATGTQIWGSRYEEEESMDAADTISPLAAIDIAGAAIDSEWRRTRDADIYALNAWDLCIRVGGSAVNTMAEQDECIRLLRLATERDPNFALAHSWLGAFLAQSVFMMFSRKPEEDIAEALQHADRSLFLMPDNPMVMHGAALTHRIFGNEALAMNLAERADAAGGHGAMFGSRGLENGLFDCLIQAGREEEAIEKMLTIRPPPERTLCRAYGVHGNWPQALIWAQRRVATQSEDFIAWAELANALAMLGRKSEAAEALQRVTSMLPTFKLRYYEKALRLYWRNREPVVDALLAGLRKLDLE